MHDKVEVPFCLVTEAVDSDRFNRYMPSSFYPARLVFFQLHTCMVSIIQALATPYSTVHNTKYLDAYHESVSVLTASIMAVM